ARAVRRQSRAAARSRRAAGGPRSLPARRAAPRGGPMKGMNRTRGTAVDGTLHLVQSIGDILSTPIGARVMRRDYGSLLPELVDAASNPSGRLAVFAATAIALRRWEPRLKLTKIELTRSAPDGQFDLQLEGIRLDLPPAAAAANLSVPLSI